MKKEPLNSVKGTLRQSDLLCLNYFPSPNITKAEVLPLERI